MSNLQSTENYAGVISYNSFRIAHQYWESETLTDSLPEVTRRVQYGEVCIWIFSM